MKDKLLWKSVIASVVVNGATVSALGYAGHLSHASSLSSKPVGVVAKAPPSRLIEIKMLADNKAKSEGGKGGNDSKSGAEKGSGSGLSDSDTGEKGASGKGAIAKNEEREIDRKTPPTLATKKATDKLARLKKKVALAGKKSLKKEGKFNLKMAGEFHLGTVHLQPPKPSVTGGHNGVVDLRGLKATINVVAENPKAVAGRAPNKFVGKNHIKIVGRPGGKSVCVATGGNTVMPSNMTILYGKDFKINGTKFCVPGGMPGIPGGQPSQSNSVSASTSSPKGASAQNRSAKGGSTKGESGDGKADHSSGQSGVRGDSGARSFDSDEKGEAAGRGDAVHDRDVNEAHQQELEANYQKLASGPLRGVSETHGNGATGPGTGIRALHLPEFHNDPTDRIPGAWTPPKERKLVDVPKEHKGAKASEGEKDSKSKEFDLAPTSVGSHSGQGTILWPMDGRPPHKPSRRVKGDGKKDGGGDGSGLLGEYFSGQNFDHEVFRRADRNIDFDWTYQVVDPKKLPTSYNFSIRWTGYIRARYTEQYKIYTASDDGEIVWIDGKIVTRNWTEHAATEDVATVDFVAGKKYPIKIEYFENGMTPAVMRLYWESAHQKKEYVPQSCLFFPEVGSKSR